MPFLSIITMIEFDKMQIPSIVVMWISPYCFGWFSDDWSLRFCAPASVGALFYYATFIDTRKEKQGDRL